jgi:histidinol phosphatase-like PHP family hydrolase
MREIDLHVHTHASDGTELPRKTVEIAKRNGLRAIAVENGIEAVVLESHKNWIEKDPVKSLELSAEWFNENII